MVYTVKKTISSVYTKSVALIISKIFVPHFLILRLVLVLIAPLT